MKKIEELFDLPQDDAPDCESPSEVNEIIMENITELDEISAALPQVNGLGDESDQEFDELADRATAAFDNLVDMGMNIEPRYSSRIFEVASSMLKNAIDAKSAKIDKKLKMIELQLKKQKLDQTTKTAAIDVSSTNIIVSDRNSILEKLKNLPNK